MLWSKMWSYALAFSSCQNIFLMYFLIFFCWFFFLFNGCWQSFPCNCLVLTAKEGIKGKTLWSPYSARTLQIKWFPCWPTTTITTTTAATAITGNATTWQRKCCCFSYSNSCCCCYGKRENSVQFTFQLLNVRGKCTKRNQSGMKAHRRHWKTSKRTKRTKRSTRAIA